MLLRIVFLVTVLSSYAASAETSVAAAQDSWAPVEAIASSIAAIVSAVALLYVAAQTRAANSQLNALQRQIVAGERQLIELERATLLQGYFAVLAYLQSDEALRARRQVLDAWGARRPFPTNRREIEAAQVVSRTYDTLGILVNRNLLPSSIFVDNWGDSIWKCWEVLETWVRKYRTTKKTGPTHWDDFEAIARLAREAAKDNGYAAE